MKTRMFLLSALSVSLLVPTAWTPGQTVATQQVMREKLVLTQHVVEALMKSDYGLLEQSSEALSRITERPGWMVLTTPEYIRYSGAFVNAAQELLQSAKTQDLDAAAVQYASIVMTCYQCHRYLKNVRIADVASIADGDGDGVSNEIGEGQRGGGRRGGAPSGQGGGGAARGPGGGGRAGSVHPGGTPRTGAPNTPPGTLQRGVPRFNAPHGSRPEIYNYPLLHRPDFTYRFPYGPYFGYRYGYPYPYGYPYDYYYGWGYPWGLSFDFTLPPDSLSAETDVYGRVEFDHAPKDAAVYVDGNYAGTIEQIERDHHLHLLPGEHHIELHATGYEVLAFDVTVQAGRKIKYRAEMRPLAPAS